MAIHVEITENKCMSVDRPEDLKEVIAVLKQTRQARDDFL
jgi:CMP-2-keto-3-deoxyoctulosonic acid synthetase